MLWFSFLSILPGTSWKKCWCLINFRFDLSLLKYKSVHQQKSSLSSKSMSCPVSRPVRKFSGWHPKNHWSKPLILRNGVVRPSGKSGEIQVNRSRILTTTQHSNRSGKGAKNNLWELKQDHFCLPCFCPNMIIIFKTRFVLQLDSLSVFDAVVT